jgi:hypothetical protein
MFHPVTSCTPALHVSQIVRPVDVVRENLSNYADGKYAMHALIAVCQTGGFDGLTGEMEV